MFARLRSWFDAVRRRDALDRQMADEMRFHLEARTDDLIASGIAPSEAHRRARAEFGAAAAYQDGCRDARGLRLVTDLASDLRYAARTLRRTPGFTAMAILSLALGIGANAVVFSVVNALILKPLPIADPSRIVFVQTRDNRPSQSYPNYLDLRDRNVSFSGLVGSRVSPINLQAGATPARIWGYLATGNYFDVLGVRPAAGRFFHAQDEAGPGSAPLAVLSYQTWQSRFGGDPAVVGRVIRLNSTPFTIIGVAPAGFNGTQVFVRPELWVPMVMEPQIEIGNEWLDVRNTWNTWVEGRLKPGVTRAAAAADLNTIAAQLGREYPKADEGLQLAVTDTGLVGDLLGAPMRAFAAGVLLLAGLVLLAACANLASVLAARGADRQRELAIRFSLGASRGRVVRQVLTETLLLSAAGGAAACCLAVIAARALSAWHPPIDVPLRFDISVDVRVLLFAGAVSTIAGLLFGLAPALHAARVDPGGALKSSDGVPPRRRGLPLRDVLVAVQVALCVLLVSASALALRGLQQSLHMAIGMQPEGVTITGFDLGLAGYTPAQGAQFQRRALDAVAGLPGVQSASYSNSLPLSIDQNSSGIYPDDQPGLRASDVHAANVYEVSPGYLDTLGIRLALGRGFTWADSTGRPRVAIVNRTFARVIMRTPNPVGRHFAYGWRSDPVEIVGMMEDGKYGSLSEAPRPAVFECILQRYSSTSTLLVRSSLPPEQMLAQVRAAIGRLDPSLTLYGSESVQEMLGFALFPSQAAAVALSAFGLLAIILAATGIHGLVAYAVSRRRREIGIRIAIGATRASVVRVVLSRIAWLLAAGAAIGLLMAALAGQILSSIVYHASPRDPVVFGATVAVMAAVGIAACWMPVRRSLRIEPMTALRPD